MSVDAGRTGVLAVSVDPQGSLEDWLRRVEARRGPDAVPFDFAQIDGDPEQIRALRMLPYRHIFVDTPGSLPGRVQGGAGHLLEALGQATDVLVPLDINPLSVEPTRETIEGVIKPMGLRFHVVINNWDARDGERDRDQMIELAVEAGWPVLSVVIRKYRVHARAYADGNLITTYPPNRVVFQAGQDMLRAVIALGYGGGPPIDGPQVHVVANQKGGVGKTTITAGFAAVTADALRGEVRGI